MTKIYPFLASMALVAACSPAGGADDPSASAPPAPDPAAPTVATIGEIAPDVELTWLNHEGGDSLADLRGRIVWLEFWRTWCRPCIDQVPHLNALQAKFDPQDLLIVGVTDEDEQLVRKSMDSHGMKFPVALVAKGLNEAYPIPGFPTTYLVDRDGTVLWKGHPGQLTEEHIDALLEEPPPEE